MGGSNSGRWGGRARCESHRAIDVREWQRAKLLDDVGAIFMWRLIQDGFGIQVNVCADDLMLSYTTSSGERHFEVIELTRTLCHYGGTRAWFHCPGCNRRTAKLYLRRERFLCRLCHGLRYRSQLWGGNDRPRLSAQGIRAKLGGPIGIALPFPLKPKGMHWRTFERMKAECQRYEMRAFAGLSAWVERFKRSVRG
jgi:hypothetical protein